MAGSEQKAPTFVGTVQVQFGSFRQTAWEKDEGGDDVFVGYFTGRVRTPDGTHTFDGLVRLPMGDKLTGDSDVYQVYVPPALGVLAAREEFRAAVTSYANACMAEMFGTNWRQFKVRPGQVSGNVIEVRSAVTDIDFPLTVDSW